MKGYNPYVLPRSSKFREGCIECQGFLCPKDCKIDSFNACVLPAIKNYNAEIITNAEVLSLETRKNVSKRFFYQSINIKVRLVNIKSCF